MVQKDEKRSIREKYIGLHLHPAGERYVLSFKTTHCFQLINAFVSVWVVSPNDVASTYKQLK